MMLGQSHRDDEAIFNDLVYSVSHDLSAPFRHIGSFSKLLELEAGDRLTDEDRAHLASLIQNSERVQNMIDAVLRYSRLKTRAKPHDVHAVHDIMKPVLEDLNGMITQKNATLHVSKMPASLYGDDSQLSLLFKILVENALLYTRDDVAPIIEISGEACGDRIVMTIVDNGRGFPKDMHDRAFRMFTRHQRPQSPISLGVGLAFAKRIVDLHGGDITIMDSPDEGAALRVTLAKDA